ncbi:MAG: hypothetical protein KDJ33_18885 [Gammaproteobacteria bacterium]|nr:hypothetical protein [Gammaproteobacteria bacterium]
MSELELSIDSAGVQRAFNLSPAAASAELTKVVRRGIGVIARDARRLAPKAFSTLTNSIIATLVDPLAGEVAPGVDYARMVEEGTGPGGQPPLQSLVDWIRVKGIDPVNPEMDARDLAFVMARSIAARGTPAQPYLVPSLDRNSAEIARQADLAVDRVLARMGAA